LGYPGVQSQYNPALPLYEVRDGFVEIPDTPGLGIDPAPEMVKKYKVG
jgi:L-alanine-DL-glutamate epimerase-like enolase superfamily enzyme